MRRKMKNFLSQNACTNALFRWVLNVRIVRISGIFSPKSSMPSGSCTAYILRLEDKNDASHADPLRPAVIVKYCLDLLVSVGDLLDGVTSAGGRVLVLFWNEVWHPLCLDLWLGYKMSLVRFLPGDFELPSRSLVPDVV